MWSRELPYISDRCPIYSRYVCAISVTVYVAVKLRALLAPRGVEDAVSTRREAARLVRCDRPSEMQTFAQARSHDALLEGACGHHCVASLGRARGSVAAAAERLGVVAHLDRVGVAVGMRAIVKVRVRVQARVRVSAPSWAVAGRGTRHSWRRGREQCPSRIAWRRAACPYRP